MFGWLRGAGLETSVLSLYLLFAYLGVFSVHL